MSISEFKPSPYHHGDLRNALIAAGVEAVRQEGMDALSLRKLARSLGVSHNAPYMHFADKESLLAAISEQGFRLLAAAIEQAGAGVTPWRAHFHAICRAYVMFVLEHPGHAQVMFRDYDSALYPDAAAAAMAAFGLLEKALDVGRHEGWVAQGPSALEAAAVWSLLHGTATILASHKMPQVMSNEQTPAALVTAFIDLMYSGLQTKSPP